MLRLLICITSVFIVSCNPQISETQTEKNDQQTYEDKRGRLNLIGEVNQNSLRLTPFNTWFKTKESYQADPLIIEELKKPIKKYSILAFFGTWCGDSRREIPRFYNILDQVDYNYDKLTIVAVGNEGSMYKKSPNNEQQGRNITHVPTFIFLDKNGNEAGRIVESTIETLEADMLKIVSQKPYKHSHDQ